MTALAGIVSWIVLPVVVALAVGLHGRFAGMETGIYVLNKIRLDLRAEAGWRSARTLRRMLENSNNLLAVILIGTNICSYVTTFAISRMFILGGYERTAQWCTLAVAAPLLFILGDSVPKNIFRRQAESLVYRFAWLLRSSSIVLNVCGLAGVVRVFSSALTRLIAPARREGAMPAGGPLAAIVAEGRASGVITHFQSVMADRIAGITRVTLADVMKAMHSAVWAPQEIGRRELIELIRDQNYSRIPLVDRHRRVVGVLDVYDVLTADEDLRPSDKMTKPLVLPADESVTDALYRMQSAKAAMAIVEDAAGRHVGIVTIKDLVEEIVGELEAW